MMTMKIVKARAEREVSYLQVTFPDAKKFDEWGFQVVNDSFTGRGRHKKYYVSTNGLPDFMKVKIRGGHYKITSDPTAPTVSKAVTPTKAVISRKFSTDEGTLLRFTGKTRKKRYPKNSPRSDVFELISIFAKQPVRRGDLLTRIHECIDILPSTASSNLSYFIHHSGVLQIVDEP